MAVANVYPINIVPSEYAGSNKFDAKRIEKKVVSFVVVYDALEVSKL